MARGKSPDGPWVTVGVSLRSGTLDRLDKALGDLTRSEWVREVAVLPALDALDAAAEGAAPPPEPSPERPRPRRAPKRQPGEPESAAEIAAHFKAARS